MTTARDAIAWQQLTNLFASEGLSPDEVLALVRSAQTVTKIDTDPNQGDFFLAKAGFDPKASK